MSCEVSCGYGDIWSDTGTRYFSNVKVRRVDNQGGEVVGQPIITNGGSPIYHAKIYGDYSKGGCIAIEPTRCLDVDLSLSSTLFEGIEGIPSIMFNDFSVYRYFDPHSIDTLQHTQYEILYNRGDNSSWGAAVFLLDPQDQLLGAVFTPDLGYPGISVYMSPQSMLNNPADEGYVLNSFEVSASFKMFPVGIIPKEAMQLFALAHEQAQKAKPVIDDVQVILLALEVEVARGKEGGDFFRSVTHPMSDPQKRNTWLEGNGKNSLNLLQQVGLSSNDLPIIYATQFSGERILS